jgi:gluconokinase
MSFTLLRSPYVKIAGIYYLARMIDKIRVHAAGQLPAEFQANLGTGFDGRALSFLWIEYPALVDRVKQGGTDEEIVEWAFTQGRRPSAEEIEVWNDFMRKRGWNDEAAERLAQRKAENGFQSRDDIRTMFDYIDADEGRDPKVTFAAG